MMPVVIGRDAQQHSKFEGCEVRGFPLESGLVLSNSTTHTLSHRS